MRRGDKRDNSLNFRGLARPARLELATYGFEVRCSIQLSYGRLVSLLLILVIVIVIVL